MAIIGAGRVGTTLAVLLEGAGHPIVMASGRESSRARARRYLPSTPFFRLEAAPASARSAELVVLAVPDDALADVCLGLADGGAFVARQLVMHTSGSIGLDVLAPAAAAQAEILSVHPLQAFPDVEDGIARLPGSHIAVTARTATAVAAGESIARDLGGHPFRLPEDAKALYHAGAVFASNYLVATIAIAEELLGRAGLERARDLLGPLARAVLEETLDEGPGGALTGPAARGETETVARHLGALSQRAPDAVEPYVALARVAARVASLDGRLAEDQRARLEEELTRWR